MKITKDSWFALGCREESASEARMTREDQLEQALRGLLTAVSADARVKRGDYYHERKAAREALAIPKGLSKK